MRSLTGDQLVFPGVEQFSYEWMRMNASYADEQGDWKRKERRGEKKEEPEQYQGEGGKLQC